MSCQQASRLITTTTTAAAAATTAIGTTQAIAISSSSSSSSTVHKPPPSSAATTFAPTNCSSVLAATPEDPYVFTDTLSTTPPILFNTQKSRARANEAQHKNNNNSKQATTIAAAAAAAAAATTPTHLKAASIANGKLATTPPIIQLNGGITTATAANGGGLTEVAGAAITNGGTKQHTNFNSVTQSLKQQQQQQHQQAANKRATNVHCIVRPHQQELQQQHHQQQKVQRQTALTRPTQLQSQPQSQLQSQLYSHTPSLWQTPLLLDSVAAAAAAAAAAVSPTLTIGTATGTTIGTAKVKQQQQHVSISSPGIVAAVTPPLNVVSPPTPPATLPSPNAASHTTPASLITPSSVLSSAVTTAPPTTPAAAMVSSLAVSPTATSGMMVSSSSPVMVVGCQPLPPSKFHHTTLAQHLQKVECLKKPKRVATLPLAANLNLVESPRVVTTVVSVSQPPPLKAFGSSTTMAMATTNLITPTALQQQQQHLQQQHKHSADDDNDLNEIPVNVIFRKPIANESVVTTVSEQAAAIVAMETTHKMPKSLKIVSANMKVSVVPPKTPPKPQPQPPSSVSTLSASSSIGTTTVTSAAVAAAAAMSNLLVQTHFNGGTQSSLAGQSCMITPEKSVPVIKSVIIPQTTLCSLPLSQSPQQQQPQPPLPQQQQQPQLQLSSTTQAAQPKRKTMAAGGTKTTNAASKRNNKKNALTGGVVSSMSSQSMSNTMSPLSSSSSSSSLVPSSVSVMPAALLLSNPNPIVEDIKHKKTITAEQKHSTATLLSIKENIPRPTAGDTTHSSGTLPPTLSVDGKATKNVSRPFGKSNVNSMNANDENVFSSSTMMDGDDYVTSDKQQDENHTYCLQRHWMHDASTLAAAPLSSNQREERIAEHKSLLRHQALQLLATRSLQKEPISLARQRLQCVERLLQKCHNRNKEQETPGKKCLFPNCNEATLAMSSHCLRHIVNNTTQKIFTPCIAKNGTGEGELCRAPVFDLWHEVALCNEHKSLRNQYEEEKIQKQKNPSGDNMFKKEAVAGLELLQMLPQQCSNLMMTTNAVATVTVTGMAKQSITLNPSLTQQRKRKVLNGGTGKPVGRPQKRVKKPQLQQQQQQQQLGGGGGGLLPATATTLPPISAVLQRKSSTTSLESITSNSQSSSSQAHYAGGASSNMHTNGGTPSFASLPALAPLSNTHNVMLSMSNNKIVDVVASDVTASNFGNLNMMINTTTNNFKGDHDQDLQDQIAAHFANPAGGVNHNNNNIINQYNPPIHCSNNNNNSMANNYLNLNGNANFATAVNSSDFNPHGAAGIFSSANSILSHHHHHRNDDILTQEMFSVCENSSAYASSEDTGLGGISESELMGPQETDDIPLVDPRLLEEHDLANVLNNLPVDAFNELFTSVRQDECDEMDRQLELADKHIRSLQQSMGSDSDFLGDFLDVNDDILADTAADICSKMDIVSSVMNSPDTSGIDAATLFVDSSNGAASNSDGGCIGIGVGIHGINGINGITGLNGINGDGSNCGGFGANLGSQTTLVAGAIDNCAVTNLADIRGLLHT